MSDKQMVSRPGGRLWASGATVAIGATGVDITVPAGKEWELLGFTCDLTTSATVGNRIMQMRITDAVLGVLWIGAASGSVAASQVGGYDVSFGAPLATPSTTVRRNRANTANTNVQVRETSSVRFIRAGAVINIDDSANIDNADSLAYLVYYREYEA